jgi:tetratricopeptide (TPR) repeat protein
VDVSELDVKNNLDKNDFQYEVESQKSEIKNNKSVSHPVELRQQVIQDFDTEVQNEELKKSEAKNQYLKNANILLKNTEYDYAEVLFRKALAENSKNVEAIIGLGCSFLGRYDVEKALKCFKVSIELEQSPLALSYIGDCYYFKAEDELAIHYYEQAIRGLKYNSQRLFEIYKNIGNVYVRKNQYEFAEENYNKAYTINPDSDVLLVNYGTLEIQKGELDIAQQRFKSAIYINKENDKAWLGLSLVHREFGDLELSWGSLNRSLDINPSNQVSLQLALDWAFRDNKIDQIIGRLEYYTSLNDQDAEVNFLLAQVLFKTGRYYHAKMEMEKVLALDPQLKGAEDLMSFIIESITKMENRSD